MPSGCQEVVVALEQHAQPWEVGELLAVGLDRAVGEHEHADRVVGVGLPGLELGQQLAADGARRADEDDHHGPTLVEDLLELGLVAVEVGQPERRRLGRLGQPGRDLEVLEPQQHLAVLAHQGLHDVAEEHHGADEQQTAGPEQCLVAVEVGCDRPHGALGAGADQRDEREHDERAVAGDGAPADLGGVAHRAEAVAREAVAPHQVGHDRGREGGQQHQGEHRAGRGRRVGQHEQDGGGQLGERQARRHRTDECGRYAERDDGLTCAGTVAKLGDRRHDEDARENKARNGHQLGHGPQDRRRIRYVGPLRLTSYLAQLAPRAPQATEPVAVADGVRACHPPGAPRRGGVAVADHRG